MAAIGSLRAVQRALDSAVRDHSDGESVLWARIYHRSRDTDGQMHASGASRHQSRHGA